MNDSNLPSTESVGRFDSAVLDAILNTAVDAIVTIDSQGTVLHSNRAIEKLFGYSSSDLVGQNVSMLMPEPDRSRHDGYLKKYLETGKANIIGIGRQVMGRRADGTLIPVDLAISEVHIDDRLLFTAIMRDMTERRQTEADLRAAQLQLIQSERLAAIGQMVTGLAHESRNALQRSRACLDVLDLDLEQQPEQKDLVRRIRSALVELQNHYEEVRIYAAPIQLEKTRHVLGELCRQAWQMLEHQTAAMNLKLDLIEVDRFSILCDPNQVCQVLRNVYENAIFVSPRDAIIYTLCRTILVGEKKFVQTIISDDGPGLDETQRSHIFEPFFTTKTKGTGLGMAICKRIVDAHDGQLYVGGEMHRHPNSHGAVIVIELPA
jgi:two-component system sensor kinase FixL